MSHLFQKQEHRKIGFVFFYPFHFIVWTLPDLWTVGPLRASFKSLTKPWLRNLSKRRKSEVQFIEKNRAKTFRRLRHRRFEEVEGPFWRHVHDCWEIFPKDAKVKFSLLRKIGQKRFGVYAKPTMALTPKRFCPIFLHKLNLTFASFGKISQQSCTWSQNGPSTSSNHD